MSRLTTAIFYGLASVAGRFSRIASSVIDPLTNLLVPHWSPTSIGAHRGRASRRHTGAAQLKRAARRRRNVRARVAK